MKYPISILLIFVVLMTAWGLSQPPEGYTLSWSDEFDGKAVDTQVWHFRLGVSKESFQRAENVSLSGGMLRIAQKKEPFGGREFTGGGLITSKKQGYGYYETRVKMGGSGWHEAFWTTWLPQMGLKADPALASNGLLEIDAFEHYGNHDGRTYTFGAIQWAPVQGNLSREYLKVSNDLVAGFHTFGFEIQPDILRFFFDGREVGITDLRGRAQHSFYLWLSSIATFSNAVDGGEALFDYTRFYSADPETVHKRRNLAFKELDRGGAARPAGTDLWIEAEDFPRQGGWVRTLESGSDCLRGHQGKDKVKNEGDRIASTKIFIPSAGSWTLWVRSRDYQKDPGLRFFDVSLGGQKSPVSFGKHGRDGWSWENGGVYVLPKGVVDLKLLDASAWYPRADKLLLTLDKDFVPDGAGGRKNVEHDPVQY